MQTKEEEERSRASPFNQFIYATYSMHVSPSFITDAIYITHTIHLSIWMTYLADASESWNITEVDTFHSCDLHLFLGPMPSGWHHWPTTPRQRTLCCHSEIAKYALNFARAEQTTSYNAGQQTHGAGPGSKWISLEYAESTLVISSSISHVGHIHSKGLFYMDVIRPVTFFVKEKNWFSLHTFVNRSSLHTFFFYATTRKNWLKKVSCLKRDINGMYAILWHL